MEDFYGYRCQLHYIRDKDGREVDFVTIKDGEVEDLIEVKLWDEKISSALKYYTDKLKPKRVVQIIYGLKRPYYEQDILFTNPIHYFLEFHP